MQGIDAKTFFLLVVICLFIMAWWSNNTMGNRIHCIFRRKNRTDIEKAVPLKDGTVTFDGGVYEIDPRRFTLFKYSRGIIGWLFPVWMPSLHFNWSSRVAENPDDFNTTWDTPDARAIADSRSDWRGMNAGIDTQTGKKPGLLGNWMIWVVIIGIVALAFFIWQDHNHIAAIEKFLIAGGKPPGAK